MNAEDTIAALATAPASGGVAVIRVSGVGSRNILSKFVRNAELCFVQPEKLIYTRIRNPVTMELVDSGLVVFFKGPKSFTGEDTVEFHIHGSLLLARRFLALIYENGARPAQAGEFSRRAFLNGKIDLVQAEAISDLVSANSDRALDIARGQFQGQLSKALNDLGEPLRDLTAELEACLDFPEEDITPDSISAIKGKLESIQRSVRMLSNSYQYGAQIKEGYKVLLFGKPNVGKSSLLNAFLEKDRAIVTEISGTTRDLLEEFCLLQGYSFVFCDSAGIRESDDLVEQIGVARSKERLNWADLILLVVDSQVSESFSDELLNELNNLGKDYWIIFNKVDLTQPDFDQEILEEKHCFKISAKTGIGMDALKEALVKRVEECSQSQLSENLVITNERHLFCLKEADKYIEAALTAFDQDVSPEFAASEVRLALVSLEELVGRTYTEDILGRIFSKFCIGK